MKSTTTIFNKNKITSINSTSSSVKELPTVNKSNILGKASQYKVIKAPEVVKKELPTVNELPLDMEKALEK